MCVIKRDTRSLDCSSDGAAAKSTRLPGKGSMEASTLTTHRPNRRNNGIHHTSAPRQAWAVATMRANLHAVVAG